MSGVSNSNLQQHSACIASILNLVYRLKLKRSGDVTWNLLPIVALTYVSL